jgi:hypothetical protein
LIASNLGISKNYIKNAHTHNLPDKFGGRGDKKEFIIED